MDDKKVLKASGQLSFEIKSPLEFDLRDQNGELIYPAGKILTPAEIEDVLNRGVRSAQQREGPSDAEIRLLAPYDEEARGRLDDCFHKATVIVEGSVESIRTKSDPKIAALNELFGTYLQEIDSDPANVLASLSSSLEGRTRDECLAERSVRLAVLGTTIACTLGVKREGCLAVSAAGLFHDLALFESLEERFKKRIARRRDTEDDFRQHPLHSAELLHEIEGISADVRLLVTQVHEQVDGSGFPVGLLAAQQHPQSRILNLADAYLTLVGSLEWGHEIAPSDAMAYLLYHAREGRFDRDCMNALLKCNSIYPIGSQVELDDATTATILRSSVVDHLCPIVRLDRSHEIIDLRKSERSIVRPWFEPTRERNRIGVEQFKHVFWQR